MKQRRISISNFANILAYNTSTRIVKAEYQHKALRPSEEIEPIDAATMLKSIIMLEDNVVFSNAVDWTYENVSEISDTEDFIVYGDFHDNIIGTVVVIHLIVEDGHTVEEVEQKLRETIFSKVAE